MADGGDATALAGFADDEHEGRPRPALTVDKSDIGPCQILKSLDVLRVTIGNQQALFPKGEVDKRQRFVRQVLFNKRNLMHL